MFSILSHDERVLVIDAYRRTATEGYATLFAAVGAIISRQMRAGVQVVRVRCPHREGLAYREGDTLSLLPCDCNGPSEVLAVIARLEQ